MESILTKMDGFLLNDGAQENNVHPDGERDSKNSDPGFSIFSKLPLEIQDMVFEKVDCPRVIVISAAVFDPATKNAIRLPRPGLPFALESQSDGIRAFADSPRDRYNQHGELSAYPAPMHSNFTLPAITQVPGGTSRRIMRQYPYQFSGQLYTAPQGIRFRNLQDTLIFETDRAFEAFNRAAPEVTLNSENVPLSPPLADTHKDPRYLGMIKAHAGVRFLGIGFGNWGDIMDNIWAHGVEVATYRDLEILYLPEPLFPVKGWNALHTVIMGASPQNYYDYERLIDFRQVTGRSYHEKRDLPVKKIVCVQASTIGNMRQFLKRQYSKMMELCFGRAPKVIFLSQRQVIDGIRAGSLPLEEDESQLWDGTFEHLMAIKDGPQFVNIMQPDDASREHIVWNTPVEEEW